MLETQSTDNDGMISKDFLPPSDDDDESNDSGDEKDDTDLVVNINRKQVAVYEETDESDDD